ncbi:MAG: hypothetical protein AB7O45_00010 [Alphaproteobacteria bacterium]
MADPRFCCVLASDAHYFYHARACIESLRAALRSIGGVRVTIALISMGLTAEQREWAAARGVELHEPHPDVPRYPDAPAHTYALTCRPYLPAILPGHDAYAWVDTDLRFLRPEGIAYFIGHGLRAATPVVIAPECDPAYVMMNDLAGATRWLAGRDERVRRVWGKEVLRRQRMLPNLNAGLFAAPAPSPFWAAFQRRLGEVFAFSHVRMYDQDALNVAILDLGRFVRAPTTMNWMCSWALPVRGEDGTWRHPDHPREPIYTLHLTNSEVMHTIDGRRERLYDHYRRIGLPA